MPSINHQLCARTQYMVQSQHPVHKEHQMPEWNLALDVFLFMESYNVRHEWAWGHLVCLPSLHRVSDLPEVKRSLRGKYTLGIDSILGQMGNAFSFLSFRSEIVQEEVLCITWWFLSSMTASTCYGAAKQICSDCPPWLWHRDCSPASPSPIVPDLWCF